MTDIRTSSDAPSRRTLAGARFRAGLHMVMGIIYVILGITVFYLKHFGTLELQSVIAYLLGGLFCLYGLFRLWRGYTDFRHMRSGIE